MHCWEMTASLNPFTIPVLQVHTTVAYLISNIVCSRWKSIYTLGPCVNNNSYAGAALDAQVIYMHDSLHARMGEASAEKSFLSLTLYPRRWAGQTG